MLKATAATTVGAALFSGSAAATDPAQINWCGCSQVCLEEQPSGGGAYLVIVADETDAENDLQGGIWLGWKF